MVVDRRQLDRLLREMQANVELLQGVATASKEDLTADPLRLNGVLYTLQCAIEAVVSISSHIVAECNLGLPENTPEIMEILARHGVISDAGLVERLPKMVRFRNLLVHRYWQVDVDAVLEILRRNLSDFELFAREIAGWVQRHAD